MEKQKKSANKIKICCSAFFFSTFVASVELKTFCVCMGTNL